MAGNRLWAAAVAVAALAVLAGCGGAPQLDDPAAYEWNTSANATYDVRGLEYHAIYRVDAGQTVEVYQTLEIGGEQSLSISGLQFRYQNGSVLYANGTMRRPDGTTVSGAEIPVEQSGERRAITAPSDGRIAYTAPTQPKSFRTPVFVEGSHEVILPTDMRISMPLLGVASPGGYDRSIVDDRVHLRWSDTPGGTLDLRYYLERDQYIFGGIVLAGIVLAIGGTIYYRRRIRELEQTRREEGIDLDQ